MNTVPIQSASSARQRYSTAMQGFTIIELVVILVLVGIVAVTIVARYFSPSALSGAAARDAIVTAIRAAQQAALGRSSVTFEIDAVSGNWVMTAKAGTDTVQTARVSTSSLALETGTALIGAGTCSAGLDTAVANDFTLSFDSQGNLSSFLNNGVTQTVNASFNGVRLCVNDTDALSVCVSPAGYASVGNCDD